MTKTYQKKFEYPAIQFLGLDNNKFGIAEFFKGSGEFSLRFNNDGTMDYICNEYDFQIHPKNYILKDENGKFCAISEQDFLDRFSEIIHSYKSERPF